MQPTPLAIVGVGCLFPGANNGGRYWATVKHGDDGIGPIPATHWNPDDYFDPDPKSPDKTYARRGGFLTPIDFNPIEFGIAPRDLEATDTTQLLGLVAAKQALSDANVRFADGNPGPGKVERSRVSVILGVTGTLELVIPLGARLGHPKWKRAMREAGIAEGQVEDAAARIAESYVPWQENSFPGLLGNVVAGRIANRLDLHGTNCVVDAACASSLSAIHLASMELHTGKADVVVTGGCDTFNDIFMYMCFSKTPALSPSGDSKPFDAAGDGTTLGEGLGMVVLKRLADAERDGNTIYAVLKGVGTSSDGKGNAIYAPSAAGQTRCLRDAYEVSGVDPATVELVEAHGTGTKVGDSVEAQALAEVYGASGRTDRPWCALGSVKSQIGHTKAAAGAAGLIKAALALYHKVLPPTIKLTRPVEPLTRPDTPFSLNAQMRPWLGVPGHPRRAAVSAFGFGGSNFHAVLEEHTPIKAEPDWDGRVEILALSGATAAAIATQLDTLGVAPDWAAFGRAAEASRQSFAVGAVCRLVLVAKRGDDLAKVIADVRAKLRDPKAGAEWSTPAGAHYGSGGTPGKLAVLFPGQGSQSVGMLRELSCTFPEALESLQAFGPQVAARIYPPRDFSPSGSEDQEAALRATEVAQPAIGAVSLGAWRILHERFNVQADAFLGHSYGELTALCAAGAIAREDFVKLSQLRGRLMADAAGADGGAMLAVLAPRETVEAAIEAVEGVVVANHNAPEQVVISGARDAVTRVEAELKLKGIRSVRLAVAAAFHSPLVATAAAPFRTGLDGVEVRCPAVPVVADSTGAVYPDDPAQMRAMLGEQLARPVEFVRGVQTLVDLGIRTVIEVGPGSVLTRLAGATLVASPSGATVFALDTGGGVLDCARLLARLAAMGHAVSLAAWNRATRSSPEPVRPKHAVVLSGANVVNPRPTRAGWVNVPVDPSSARQGSPVTPEPNPAADLAQKTLAALLTLQEQTARLHQQFLDGQAQAQATLARLLSGQYAAPTPVPVPLPRPAPTSVTLPEPSPSELAPVTEVTRLESAVTPVIAAPRPAPELSAILLEVVAEKTGYPVEMIDLDASLDGDLGVDSIKRVEILGALQDRLPDAPQVRPEHLGALHTLRDIADFLGNGVTSAEREQPMTVADDGMAPLSARELADDPESALLTLPGKEDIETTLREVVAEKTGYPVEMIDLDASLDGDLGVDSIKRVEILGALQDRLPDAPQVRPEHLGALHTLRDIADFLGNGVTSGGHTTKIDVRPALPVRPRQPEIDPSVSELLAPRTVPLPSRAARRSVPRTAASENVDRSILQLVDLEVTGGRALLGLPRDGTLWLVAPADELADELERQLAEFTNVTRLPWADASSTAPPETPERFSGLVLLAPLVVGALPLNRLALGWLQVAGARLRGRDSSGPGLLASVARLDGEFGLGDLSVDTDPATGGLAGLIKTARHEWPDLASKSIDLSARFATDNLTRAAATLADELIHAGPVEVGITPQHRSTLELARAARRMADGDPALSESDVVFVTGGARGVTAEVAVALAETYRGTYVLTGRTLPPAGDEPDSTAGITDEFALKKLVAERLGAGATPKSVSEALTQLLNQREVTRTVARIEAAGARVAYFPLDVANGRQVADVIQRAQAKFGPVTALVHGAGVLADRRLEDLTPELFDRVYATKVGGLQNLLELTAHQELKAIVLFSSTTARFGRVGQASYAAANEVLNKTAQIESRRRPGARVIAINWGPWEGGMVTPALKKLFEHEQVGLIPLSEGAAFAVQELAAGGRSVEVIALGRPPRPVKVGSGPLRVTTPPPPLRTGPPAATTPPVLELVTERVVDVASHPVLRSHVLKDAAVLPMALHLEWLAHAAAHANPGLVFSGVDQFRIVNGVKVDASANVTVRAYAARPRRVAGGFAVTVELRGAKKATGRDAIYSRAEVLLSNEVADAPEPRSVESLAAYPTEVADAYREFLFHGPQFQGLERVSGLDASGVIATARTAPSPAEWMVAPPRPQWLADPLVLDSAFQLVILWTQARLGSGSLPCFVESYRQYVRDFPAGEVEVRVAVQPAGKDFVHADIDFVGPDGELVARLVGLEQIIDDNLGAAFRRNQLAEPARI